MAKELKRRDLSGIFIFDTFPGESHRLPTCIEDCQPETRRRLLLTKSTEWQRDCIMKLAETFKDLCNYLVTEHCVSDEQRTEFFKMIDRNVERAKLNQLCDSIRENGFYAHRALAVEPIPGAPDYYVLDGNIC